jgi:primosomal protein N' (replication factor Y)
VIVLDEHDETYQQEQAPTWHARDVVAERARRAGAPCLLVSPCPTLEALGWGELVVQDRGRERAAWPRVEVVDQRELDPALGPLFSPRLVDLLRSDERVLCVLNRIGRARLLACASCATLARCEACDAAVALDADGTGLACGRCGTRRPLVCLSCGGSRFKNLRLGVSRAREELEALAGTPVAEVTASTPADDPGLAEARVLVGTEAVLHRVARAGVVAFLDFDQELLAVRYRAAEEALGLLARAGRLVARGRGDRGLVLVQTRTPDHPAVSAAVHADPDRLVRGELPMRRALGLPPATAMAVVSGEAAGEFVAALGRPPGIVVQGPSDQRWRLVAPDHATLADALAAVPRPPGRLRLEVDPLRI